MPSGVSKSPMIGCQWFGVLAAATCLCVLSPILRAADDAPISVEKFFDPDHLVDVKIEIDAEDWKLLCSETRTFAESLGKTPAKRPFQYYKGNVTVDGVRVENVKVRKKGFLGSLDEIRPSLKIKFGEQSPITGLDRLTLNNNKQDRSLSSQFLTYRLFNKTGSIASLCNHARVTVNGEYLGVYSNVESVKALLLERRFGDGSGHLFEGTLADLLVDTTQKFEKKTDESDRENLTRLAAILGEEELNVEELEKLLDVDAFLKFWALESMIGFWDGYTNNQNNYFMYRDPKNSKFYFIPWGTDSAFTSTMPLPPFFIAPKSVHHQAVLANRLYRNQQTQERYHETLRSLLKDHWKEEEVLAELDRIEELLKDHLHPSQKDFHGAVRKMRGFVNSRRKVLQREIDGWPAKLRGGPRRPTYFGEIGSFTATFSTTWSDKSPAKPLEVGSVDIKMTVNGKPVAFRQIGVSAEPSKWPAPGATKKPPSIVLNGKRASDGKQLTMAIGLPSADFHPSQDRPATAQGMIIEGAFGFLNPMSMKFLSGTVHFDEAEMKPGATVKGRLELKVMKMRGGKPTK